MKQKKIIDVICIFIIAVILLMMVVFTAAYFWQPNKPLLQDHSVSVVSVRMAA